MYQLQFGWNQIHEDMRPINFCESCSRGLCDHRGPGISSCPFYFRDSGVKETVESSIGKEGVPYMDVIGTGEEGDP